MKTVNIDGIDYDVLNDSSSITNHEGSITVSHLDKSFTVTLDEIKSRRYKNYVSESSIYRLIADKAINNKLTYHIIESSNFLTKVRKNVIEATYFANKVIKEDIISEENEKAKEALSKFNEESFTISELIEKLHSIKEEHGDLKISYDGEIGHMYEIKDMFTIPNIKVKYIYLYKDSELSKVKSLVIESDYSKSIFIK